MNEQTLNDLLERLTPSDFTRLLLRMPEATGLIPVSASHTDRVAALVTFARSSRGKGMAQLGQVYTAVFPECLNGSAANATNHHQERTISPPKRLP